MKVSFMTRTELSPTEAARKLTSMENHRVPFTSITADGGMVRATTRLGPLTIIDDMEISPLQVSGPNVRGLITKTGSILGGTLEFAAVRVDDGTIVGFRQNLRFLPCPLLNPVLAVVMRAGYGIGFRRLLSGGGPRPVRQHQQ